MPLINYEPLNFVNTQNNKLTGKQDIKVSWLELLWASITVGKMNIRNLFAYRSYSVHEILCRIHLIQANLRTNNNHYFKSSVYENSEKNEKIFISYNIGMACAKLISSKLFDVPWLFHLKHRAAPNLGTNPGDKPDLLGQDRSGNWFVVEAKGRSNGFDRGALNGAKTQTSRVRSINGNNQIRRIAVESYFNGALKLKIQDPPEPSENSLKLIVNEVNERELLRDYYDIIAQAIFQNEKQEYDSSYSKVRIANLGCLGLTIGLYEPILTATINNGLLKAKKDLIEYLDKQNRNNIITEFKGLFDDGVLIKVDNGFIGTGEC